MTDSQDRAPPSTSDVSGWMTRIRGRASSYSAHRIEESYKRTDEILARCGNIGRRAALDVGCGAGFDSFAWRTRFDRVVAIDTSRVAIREARRIAAAGATEGIEFVVADAERFTTQDRFDLVWCNIMSHNTKSRRALISRLAQPLTAEGCVAYAEECEGYAPMEIERAIERRDEPMLATRLRQVINGFVGGPGFRFFLAGTAPGLLERQGLEVTDHHVQAWKGLPIVERTFARQRPRQPVAHDDGEDPDYAAPPACLQRLRPQFEWFTSKRGRQRFDARERGEIDALAKREASRLAPFLLFLRMADLALPAFTPDAALAERLGWRLRRVPGRLRPSEPPWEELADINRTFLELVQGAGGVYRAESG